VVPGLLSGVEMTALRKKLIKKLIGELDLYIF